MMLSFSDKQIEKLSSLFMDLAKGLILAGFVGSFAKNVGLLPLLEYFFGGILCVYLSLYLLELKK